MATKNPCLYCSKEAYGHHQAIDCDSCKGWQHRKCGNTGLTRYQYAKLQKGEISHTFVCDRCLDQVDLDVPAPNSVADISDIDDDIKVSRPDETPYSPYSNDTVTDVTTDPYNDSDIDVDRPHRSFSAGDETQEELAVTGVV